MAVTPEDLTSLVQVNIPFPFLLDGYLEKFLQGGLNPEIGLDGDSLGRYPPGEFRRMARAFREARRRVTLHGPFQDMSPGALDDWVLQACRRRLRQAFKWLPVFKPVSIVCHLAYEARFYQWARDEWLARSAATWKEFTARAAALGVTVMLENVYETEPELFLEVISRVGAPNFKVCFDVGHLHSFGDGDFDRWLNTLGSHIGQLHLHDNNGDGDDHLALGRGTVPVKHVLNYLASHKIKPIITLEPHQEGSLGPSLEYLAQIWPW